MSKLFKGIRMACVNDGINELCLAAADAVFIGKPVGLGIAIGHIL